MPVVQAKELAYVRLRSPDLEKSERFLLDFGFQTVERNPEILYARGTDAAPPCQIVELGDTKTLGFGFLVDDSEDLVTAAQLEGASAIEPSGLPGGGQRVRLTDPHGYAVDLLHGIEPLPEIKVQHQVVNIGSDRLRRAGTFYRRPQGPARIKRIGHVVLGTTDLKGTLAWYRETLGFISSDDVYVGSPDNLLASFNRLQRGQEYVDHHVFLAAQSKFNGLNHMGFEVQDHDDVMFGHEHLTRAGLYKHVWGIGRHVLGSQIFDTWWDPWERGYEFWTDTDVLNADNPSVQLPKEEGFTSAWGSGPPEYLINHVSP